MRRSLSLQHYLLGPLSCVLLHKEIIEKDDEATIPIKKSLMHFDINDELVQTRAFASHLHRFVLDEKFTLFRNQLLLFQPLCRYASSKPDLALFH